jgi:hypothetical protein
MINRSAKLSMVVGLEAIAAARAEPAGDPVPPSDAQLTLLSVDVRTLPGALARQPEADAPRWRTSFGSERRSEAATAKPTTSVDADIVLLQGVTDVRALRRWFPAGQWRVVASRQLIARIGPITPEADAPEAVASPLVPSTAIAVRLRRGLRLTAQSHLAELADALGQGTAAPTAAGTAVRVMIDNRETWAISVHLPDGCASGCPGREALQRWHDARASENIRRVTGGLFEPATATDKSSACAQFGLRLDPPPPPPRPRFTPASLTPDLGCAAAVTVAK